MEARRLETYDHRFAGRRKPGKVHDQREHQHDGIPDSGQAVRRLPLLLFESGSAE